MNNSNNVKNSKNKKSNSKDSSKKKNICEYNFWSKVDPSKSLKIANKLKYELKFWTQKVPFSGGQRTTHFWPFGYFTTFVIIAFQTKNQCGNDHHYYFLQNFIFKFRSIQSNFALLKMDETLSKEKLEQVMRSIRALWMLTSVWPEKSPNVNKSCPKMISLEKW